VQLRRALNAGYLPTIPALYNHPQLLRALPIAGKLRNAGEDSWVVRPSTVAGKNYSAVSASYYRVVHDILSLRVSVARGLSDLEKELVHLTGFRPGPPPR